MRGLRGVPLVLAAALAACILTARLPPADAAQVPPALAERVAPLLPAVAAIRTVARTPSGRMFFSGSGFVIDPSGLVVTNKHVIKGADEIMVDLPGALGLKAKPIFISEAIDLALLKVDAGRPLTALKLGDSDKVRIGDAVLVIGNPLGVGESLSEGVVSALNRDIRETPFDNFIQTDAAINHGNSGGPMFNLDGEVIGINTALYSSPGNSGSIGIGFAMPINDAHFVIDQFLSSGRVRGGWVGVEVEHITPELAVAFGMKEPRGAIVARVDEKGPAGGGKIRVGDIILQVDGEDVSDPRALARLVVRDDTGAIMPVVLLRDGVRHTVNLTVGETVNDPKRAMAMLGRMETEMMAATPSNPGMTLAPMSTKLRTKFGLRDDQAGVVVTAVEPNSAAANEKIVPGDVIVAVRHRAVRMPADVERALWDIAHQKIAYAALLVQGERGIHWTTLPIGPDR
ncbi:MAG: trypsin-like peptidase domain-containing protein [Alphaproteobacteria bacterium]|nr:trypsin-like peptidase domain-containing protein [Alphaproteobacteria bacterium]